MDSKSQQANEINKTLMQEMYGAGVHLGRKKSSVINPKMKPFIHGVKNNVHVINLEKTAEKLSEALRFLEKLAQGGGKIIFVGTKPVSRAIIAEAAQRCSQPSVTRRWLGGTLTNFPTIAKRIQFLKDLEQKKASGELEKYTKKERLQLEKKLQELTEQLGGLRNLERLPQAVFVVDVKENAIAVREAKKKRIPVVGLVDINADPTPIEYPVPANNNAVSSIRYLVNTISETILSFSAKPTQKSAKEENTTKEKVEQQ